MNINPTKLESFLKEENRLLKLNNSFEKAKSESEKDELKARVLAMSFELNAMKEKLVKE